MVNRIAVSLSLVAFAICLVAGGLVAGNPLATTLQRALLAMAGTYAVGLVVGLMGRRMIEENRKSEGENLRNSRTEAAQKDR